MTPSDKIAEKILEACDSIHEDSEFLKLVAAEIDKAREEAVEDARLQGMKSVLEDVHLLTDKARAEAFEEALRAMNKAGNLCALNCHHDPCRPLDRAIDLIRAKAAELRGKE